MIHYVKKYFVFVIVGVVIISVIFLIKHKESESTFIEEENDLLLLEDEEYELEFLDEIEEEITSIIVDVKGEVKKPGVYEVSPSSRVNDVIQLAGGFTKEADENQINLAQKVEDEMVIIIPKIGDEKATISSTVSSAGVDESKVNINQATKEELETLPGIGPAKAQAILDFREENGHFKEVEDLLQVNGIGEKTLENLQEHIAVR